MKVAIITWCCYYNFGTYLQAYALQAFLQKNGYNVTIINDYHYSLEQPLSVAIKGLLKKIIKKLFFKERFAVQKIDDLSVQKYHSFKKTYLSVDYQVESLPEVNQRYDIFLCGSDQIWNPGGFNREGNDFYFASFATKPKIAYAPSLGVNNIPQEHKVHFAELISDFSFLSVREKAASVLLSEICDKKVDTVLDPTFLLDRENWLDLVENKLSDEKYLFLYLLTCNQKYIAVAYSFASAHHLKVRVVKPCGVDLKIKDSEPAGPLEFLNMIAGASYVMTDSFHAAIFSIHYKKEFVVFKRFKDTDAKSQNSRVENLLLASGLENRLIGEDSLGDLTTLIGIDYQEVDKRLQAKKLHSQNYLLHAIETVKNERGKRFS